MARRRDHRGKATRTADGFDSFAARLGLGQDNMLAKSGYARGKHITQAAVELEEMYRTSWVVGRAVEVVAEDMVRGGISIGGDMEAGEKDALLKSLKSTGIPGRVSDAIKWGRLYGGAIAVILIDGHTLSDPLIMDDIAQESFRGLYVLDRHQVTPSLKKIRELGPMLGYPAYYTTNARDAMSGERIHHSRVIRFIGVDLPLNQRISEEYWGASVVERIYDRILALDSATHGAANLIFRSYLRVIGVNKYREILAAGGKMEAALHKMFALVRQFQSNEGITLLDKEDQFSTHNWTFAGIYEALQAFCEQISGATGIPLVRLLGQSPKGFSSGDSDLRTYYDTIATQQDDDLRPAYTTLFAVLSRHLWGKALPEGFSFDFQSLLLSTEVEKSQIATADAQGVAGLHTAGIINKPEAMTELRNSSRITGRFSGITDESIAAAEAEEAAPSLPEGMAGLFPPPASQ